MSEPSDPIDRESGEVAAQIDEARRQLERLRHKIAYDEKRQIEAREKARRERRREWQREHYANNREKLGEYQRQYRAAQQEKDPERFRAMKRAREQRWRDTHRDEVNEKARAGYAADPEKSREKRREFYAANIDEQRARRRDYYASHADAQLASHREWRRRTQKRRQTGLPITRLHRVNTRERRDNDVAADEFFRKPRTSEQVAALQIMLRTPPELWAAFKRDCLRARAAYYLVEQKDVLRRLQEELAKVQPKTETNAPTPQQAEEARLDAIGREVNARLRRRDTPRQPHHNDPAAPHPYLQQNNPMGINR